MGGGIPLLRRLTGSEDRVFLSRRGGGKARPFFGRRAFKLRLKPQGCSFNVPLYNGEGGAGRSAQKLLRTDRPTGKEDKSGMQEKIRGLTAHEVEQRRARKEGGEPPRTVTKSNAQIIRENVCTRFNFLNFVLAGLLFAVGAYSNMAFIAIIVLNILIGTAQQLKAKRLVDGLSILNRPAVTVVRDGQHETVEPEQIVKDDVVLLESGRQICNDAVVLSGEMEVNESLLTGESDAVLKREGDTLLSGSSVISGKCYARVTHVGRENYADALAEEVRKEKQEDSELLGAMKKVTRLTSVLIVPLGVALFLEAVLLRHAAAGEAVVASAAGLLGMLPKGLVLLISVSLAMGVARLAGKKILVQDMHSLETLAHVDVLCVDKTGTLTDGNMHVGRILPLFERADEPAVSQAQAKELACAYLAACEEENATIRALKGAFPPRPAGRVSTTIPFSSRRKWGAVGFEGVGTVFVGAPERLFAQMPPEAAAWMDEGLRVVGIGLSGGEWNDAGALPPQILPLYAIALEDGIRKNVRGTLSFFRREGVDVRVITGDSVRTAAAVAKKAGLARWREAVDLSTLGDEADYDRISREYAVFARATPKSKQQLIRALRRQGHCVAMTGDGVNDLLALREADCSIAVAEGSDASRQISQIVLLESDFTHLPQVVMEGRRVIHNVTRTAGVFFIKTIYSVLVTLFCLAANRPFPFIPIQITLIDALMEAYPSFLTVFESDIRPIRGRFLPSALSSALPFALAVTGMILYVSLTSPLAAEAKGTILYLLLILTSMAAVVKSCMPLTRLRGFICLTMAAGTGAALWLFPSALRIAPVTPEMALYLLRIFSAGMAGLIGMLAAQRALQKARS